MLSHHQQIYKVPSSENVPREDEVGSWIMSVIFNVAFMPRHSMVRTHIPTRVDHHNISSSIEHASELLRKVFMLYRCGKCTVIDTQIA